MKAKVLLISLLFVTVSCTRFSEIKHETIGKFSYAFYAPEVKAETAVPKPLFVIFHPSGSSGDDYIERWMPLLRRYGYVIAPTAGAETPYGSEEFEAGFEEALQKLKNAVPVDGQKIILISESNGAIYGYRFLAAHPDWFHAAVFVSGVLNPKEYDQIREKANEIKTHILIVHGTEDEVFKFDEAEKTAARLKELGLDVELKSMNGMQHGADPFCEDEIINWIGKNI